MNFCEHFSPEMIQLDLKSFEFPKTQGLLQGDTTRFLNRPIFEGARNHLRSFKPISLAHLGAVGALLLGGGGTLECSAHCLKLQISLGEGFLDHFCVLWWWLEPVKRAPRTPKRAKYYLRKIIRILSRKHCMYFIQIFLVNLGFKTIRRGFLLLKCNN